MDTVVDILETLLHDWIKYMEMRLLSIDWSCPPEDVGRHLRRAILETRRKGDDTRGVRDIWEQNRARLVSLGEERVLDLVVELDGDVEALEALAARGYEGGAESSGRVEQTIRRPGKRLRELRDQLWEVD
jgi:hypothetical protein